MNLLHIGDIHFGGHDPLALNSELDNIFLKYAYEHINELDLIVICGDLIDRKLIFNSEATKGLIDFISNLVKKCTDHQVNLRLLQGTETHDNDQLRNFEYLQNKYFKIVMTNDEELINCKNGELEYVLYVPEEYMSRYQDVYDKYAINSGKYAFVFLHGTFEFAAHKSQTLLSERPISTAPVFANDYFDNCCFGLVLASHIHEESMFNHKIVYPGSFSRNAFGEPKPKGFLHVTYDDGKMGLKKIKNTMAPEFTTIDMSKLTFNNETELIDFIKDAKKNTHKVRFINAPNGLSMDMLKAIATDDNDVRMLIKKVEAKDNTDPFYSVIEQNLPLPEELSAYMSMKKGIDMSSELITKYISKKD